MYNCSRSICSDFLPALSEIDNSPDMGDSDAPTTPVVGMKNRSQISPALWG